MGYIVYGDSISPYSGYYNPKAEDGQPDLLGKYTAKLESPLKQPRPGVQSVMGSNMEGSYWQDTHGISKMTLSSDRGLLRSGE